MSPEEEGIVRRKLAVIVDNLKALEPIKDMAIEEYREDLYKRKATERILGEFRIISTDLAEKLAPSAGLRNRLVHEYDLLKNSLVFKAVSMAEELYSEYVKEIENYISKST